MKKFEQIAAELRAAIERGDYAPGDRLPGENPLAEEKKVALMTARRALNTLKEEGLVESRKGAGVFVKAQRPIRRRASHRLSRQQWGEGRSIFAADDDRVTSVDRIEVDVVRAPDHIAPILNLSEGQRVCRRSRRHLLDGKPVLLSTSYLPYDLVADSAITEANPGDGGIYARLSDLGVPPHHFREEVRGAVPTEDEVTNLSLSARTPVLRIYRTAYTEGDEPVEVNEMLLDALAYVLEYDIDA